MNNNNKPFGRSLALIAAISEVVAAMGSTSMAAQQAINALSSDKRFQSRGHGRSKRSGVNVKCLNKMRHHENSSIYGKFPMHKYTPYGGAKEIARRAAQQH